MSKTFKLRIGQQLTLMAVDGREITSAKIIGFEKTQEGVDYIDLHKPLGIDPSKSLGYIKVREG